MASFVICTKMYRYVESDNWYILIDVRPCNYFFFHPHIQTKGSFHCFHLPGMLTAFSRGLNFVEYNIRDILHGLHFAEKTKIHKIQNRQFVQKIIYLG